MKITSFAAIASAALLAAACSSAPTGSVTLAGQDGQPEAARNKVLVVMSAADHIELTSGTRYKTGYFTRELTDPAKALLAAGFELEFASPGGVQPTIDTNSLELVWFFHPNPLDAIYAKSRREESIQLATQFFGQLTFSDKSNSFEVDHYVSRIKKAQRDVAPKPLKALSDVQDLSQYAAVLVPGGHAPMTDLVSDADMGRILRHFHERGKPTALICHAPVALLSTKADPFAPGDWIYAGYRVTAASRLEENLLETFGPIMGDRVSYYVDTELEKAGALLDQTLIPGGRRVSVDRELITAQSPASAAEMGAKLVEAIRLYNEGTAMGEERRWWQRRAASVRSPEPLPASLIALKAQVSRDVAAGSDAVAALDAMFIAAADKSDYLDMPNGDAAGVPLFAGDLREAIPQTNEIAGMVWGGKIFTRKSATSATLVNKVLGMPIIRANVYKGTVKDRLDEQPSIVLDYSVAEFVTARGIRDEIRKIGPGLYLGRATTHGKFVVYFALQFGA